MKAFSLFSGVGGFDLALINKGHEIVGACEIDEYARRVYANHFKVTCPESGRRRILDSHQIRHFTPLEYERLQGFPDGWTEGLSDAQRYKCMGNAVTVPVVEYILEHLT